jgi:hypothetical protein
MRHAGAGVKYRGKRIEKRDKEMKSIRYSPCAIRSLAPQFPLQSAMFVARLSPGILASASMSRRRLAFAFLLWTEDKVF